MKKSLFCLSIFLMTALSANAQIIECVSIEDTNIGIQYAKHKYEKLRSANGTIYEKGAYDHQKDMTYFSAITNKGIERIWLANKPIFIEGLATYPSSISIAFTNGMTSNVEMICYDLLQMNKKRIRNGADPSPATVLDF